MSKSPKLGKQAQQLIDLSQTVPGFIALAPRRGPDHTYLNKGDRKAAEVEYVWTYGPTTDHPDGYRLAVVDSATGELLDSVEVDAPVFADPRFGCPAVAPYGRANVDGPCRLYDHPASVPHRSIEGKEF